MLTLRRHSIRYSETDDKNLFVHFSLDTEGLGYLSSWDRFLRGEIIIKKPWIGKVNKEQNEFKILRTRTGIFKTGTSMIEIYGKLINDKQEKIIKIKMRPVWYVTVSFLGLAIFLSIMTWKYFNHIFGWTILSSFLILQILFLLLDLNKTDEKFTEYLDRSRSNALQQSA